MKAAWDWHLPRDTDAEERELVDFAAECGFDTLIVDEPTPEMVDRGHDHDLSLVSIVRPRPDDAFREENPACLQSVLPVEDAVLDALDDLAPKRYDRIAHRWFTPVHGADFLCFEREPSMEFLEQRMSEALAVADGVAFDGFGFRNHYACFCDVCTTIRSDAGAPSDPDLVRRVSEESLVDAHRRLYEHAKSIDRDAIVTNHVWPPFQPDPYYGHRLRLDYCSQTISWFHRPTWSLERVEFEAAEHARLEGDANAFVPFIGVHDEPNLRRSPERIRRELEIGLEYGDGNVVFCTLALPHSDPEVAAVLQDALD